MKKGFITGFLSAMLLCVPFAEAGHLKAERVYQRNWCEKAGGMAEFMLSDSTRVDCVTKQYAVEVDFAPKWAEAVGQALYYSTMTEKRPAILLILEKEADRRYLDRLERISGNLGITVWTITPEDLE